MTRVLIVEDEPLIALELEFALADEGYTVVGTAADLARGLALARELSFDVAVLDLNLLGQSSAPIAEVLLGRGIAFVFASGYMEKSIPPHHAHRPRVTKPFESAALRRAIELALGTRESPELLTTPLRSERPG